MKIHSARFQFSNHWVFFIGPSVIITDALENVLATGENKWTSSRGEDVDTIMGREFKPRSVDSKELIFRFKEKRVPFKPEMPKRSRKKAKAKNA